MQKLRATLLEVRGLLQRIDQPGRPISTDEWLHALSALEVAEGLHVKLQPELADLRFLILGMPKQALRDSDDANWKLPARGKIDALLRDTGPGRIC